MIIRITTIALILLSTLGSYAKETPYQLKVNGLVCPFCEYNITKKLTDLAGISDVKVNLKEGLVDLIMADGENFPEDTIRKEITDAGFTLESFKVEQPSQ